jgi:hypothetical protein
MSKTRVVRAIQPACRLAISGAGGWLSLAAAPAFAAMALLTATAADGASDILCAAARDASPLTGMVPMYVLMALFHAAPWLRLMERLRPQ